MKYTTSLLVILLSFVLFTGCNTDELNPEPKGKNIINSQLNENIEEGAVLIKLSPEIGDNFISTKSNSLTKSGNSAIDSYMQEIGAKKMTRVFPYYPDPEIEAKQIEAGLHLWYKVVFDKNIVTTKVANNFKELKGVTIAKPIQKCNPPISESSPFTDNVFNTKANDYPVNDPNLRLQWGFSNPGSIKPSVKGADINLFKAWELAGYGSPDVTVAVIDFGIDYKHKDLAPNMWKNEKELNGGDGDSYENDIYGYNFVDRTGDIKTVYDKTWREKIDLGHGTHIAGTIAAVNNNETGVCGVAGGTPDAPGTKLMSCQIFTRNPDAVWNTDGGGVDIIAEAIVYAANKGAVICQCSWNFGEYEDGAALYPEIEEAIDYFIKNAKGKKMNGGVLIFAAGNSYPDKKGKMYPPASEKVIAVASMGPDFKVASYSNRGDWVDLTAPGGVGGSLSAKIYSTEPDNNYGFQGGTSMACPHVTGVAALILSKYGSPTYTPDMLKKRLLSAIRPENPDDYNPTFKGQLGKYVDAAAAVRDNNDVKPNKVSDLKATADYKWIDLNWSVVNDGDGVAANTYKLYYSTKELTATNFTQGTLKTIDATGKKIGDKLNFKLENLTEGTTYYFALVAENKWNSISEPCCISAKTKQRNSPIITLPSDLNIKIAGNQIKEIDVAVNAQEPGDWNVKLSGDTEGVTTNKYDKGVKVTFNAKNAKIGTHSVTLTVTNAANISASVNIPYEVYRSNPPKLIKDFDQIFAPVAEEIAINLSEHFNMSENNEIVYSVKSLDENIVIASIRDNKLILNPVKIGVTNVELSASDSYNESIKATIPIQVVQNKLVYMAYPTKVKADFNVRLSNNVNQAKIKIFTSTGSLVLEQDYNANSDKLVKLNLTNLAGGNYFLFVEANGETYKQAFIKL